MLAEEYLMGWAMAEVQCLIHPGDANVFAGYTKHRKLRNDFYSPVNYIYGGMLPQADGYCALPLSPLQKFLGVDVVHRRNLGLDCIQSNSRPIRSDSSSVTQSSVAIPSFLSAVQQPH
jgi:hypothetical protein